MLKRVCQSSEDLLALSEYQPFVWTFIKPKHLKIKHEYVIVEIKITHQIKWHQDFYFPCTHTLAFFHPSESCNQVTEQDFDVEA